METKKRNIEDSGLYRRIDLETRRAYERRKKRAEQQSMKEKASNSNSALPQDKESN